MLEPHNHPRFVRGRDLIATSIKLLLLRNNLSHTDLEAFYRWAAPETAAWLSQSQISTLRNAKLPKPGPQIIDAIGEINVRLAQLSGDDSPIVRDLPKLPSLPRKLAHLDGDAWFMQNPHNGLPMDGGDYFRMYCGRLEMKGTEWEKPLGAFSDENAAEVSQRIAVWAQRWMVAHELIPMEAKERFLTEYQPTDPKRRERCWDVVLGRTQWNGPQLSEERDALRFLVGAHERSKAFSVREFDRWVKGLTV